MTNLTLGEERGVEAIQAQTDEQLRFTFHQFTNEEELDNVRYVVIASGMAAFPVSKKFFVDAIHDELIYRDLL